MLRAGEIEGWSSAGIRRVLSDYQARLQQSTGLSDPLDAVFDLLRDSSNGKEKLLTGPLTRLALLYLSEFKNGDTCFDPVAAFHLANGAILERINVFADRSTHGEQQSHAVMVNYRYDPEQVVANHEPFAREGRIVMSRNLQREHAKFIAGEA
jgi:malonyl-CoA decarboxylase